MKKALVHSYDAIHALGININEIVESMLKGVSGVKEHQDNTIQPTPFYAAKIEDNFKQEIKLKNNTDIVASLTFEIIERLKNTISLNLNDPNVLILLSSTKGNIDAIKNNKGIYPLADLAAQVKSKYLLSYTPIVISTACISGLAAIIKAKRYLEHGKYKYVLIVGVDAFSEFTFKGFQSFHALENGLCKPFDANRNGINLGECAAGMVLTNINNEHKEKVIIAGTGLSNDANHLSGPSRTGEELALAATQALKEAQLPATSIQVISAHGTATIYNDEMECKALHVANVSHAPVYSTKSYTGHTLGAAGILECIIGIELLKRNYKLANNNFETLGVPLPLNINTNTAPFTHYNFLKTASGFGGCNAAIVVVKE
jgi:3-oxoacyl-[acyl-carrier-protein] synthase-1